MVKISYELFAMACVVAMAYISTTIQCTTVYSSFTLHSLKCMLFDIPLVPSHFFMTLHEFLEKENQTRVRSDLYSIRFKYDLTQRKMPTCEN